ncbi:MAG: SDR family oxidoreductase [Chromatiaceae bacterium]|jgi:short-subunit dehydrogenase|nr:SDR family oxidoreductase [Chromatiaceae bacterium]
MNSILIIGATSAIAGACARLWAPERARFFLVGRDAEKLQQVGDDLLARGAESAHRYALDLNTFAEHETMLAACLQALERIDIALIAHGTLPDQHACERDLTQALEEFSTNGTSVVALLSRLANHMQLQGAGTIAVISSVAGDRGRASNYVYGSAKAAVTAFCEGLRGRLFAAGVHVLTVKPGFVDTPMTRGLSLPGILLAKPEQVAKDIAQAVKRRRNTVYTPWFWWGIMAAIRHIPASIFKRMKL